MGLKSINASTPSWAILALIRSIRPEHLSCFVVIPILLCAYVNISPPRIPPEMGRKGGGSLKAAD